MFKVQEEIIRAFIEKDHAHNIKAFIIYETNKESDNTWKCRGCFQHGKIKNYQEVA